MVSYSAPFAVAYLIHCLSLFQGGLFSYIDLKSFGIIYTVLMGGGFLGAFMSCQVYEYVHCLKERRSNSALKYRIQSMITTDKVQGYYMNVKYELLRENQEDFLLICERNVIWTGHEQEISELFGNKKNLIKGFDYRECQKVLYDLSKQRRSFVTNGFEQCKEEAKNKLIEKNN